MMINSFNFIIIIVVIISFDQHRLLSWAHNYPYRHYSRQPTGETTYDNQTLTNTDDESNMCHLSVRCPTPPLLCKIKRIDGILLRKKKRFVFFCH